MENSLPENGYDSDFNALWTNLIVFPKKKKFQKHSQEMIWNDLKVFMLLAPGVLLSPFQDLHIFPLGEVPNLFAVVMVIMVLTPGSSRSTWIEMCRLRIGMLASAYSSNLCWIVFLAFCTREHTKDEERITGTSPACDKIILASKYTKKEFLIFSDSLSSRHFLNAVFSYL